ncbi:MAG: DUF6596 domain-containing protein [Nocardioides sp.]
MTTPGRAVDGDVHRALAEAMAAERLRIVASLIRTTRDWDLAEDAVADAAERALLTWPRDGVPRNPAAWLTTTAARRAIDLIRRAGTERVKLEQVAELERLAAPTGVVPEPGGLGDDRLRLVFTCCHPALPLEGRVALTLRVVAALPTAAIARAFLTTEATMGQRLLRAKQKIARAGIPYRVPAADVLPDRLESVLAVVYLVFTEGYAAAAHPPLAEEAIRLGRLLVELMPDEVEPRGLLALMLLQHSRHEARLVAGELVTLEHQDRSRWDRAMIAEALALGDVAATSRGPYAVQAALAAVHALAATADETDWQAIVTLYDELLTLTPSPVVALNRAIAVGLCDGPLAGLAALDDVADDPALRAFHLLPASRGELLARAGRREEAVAELDRAIELAPTEQERRQLTRRRAELR